MVLKKTSLNGLRWFTLFGMAGFAWFNYQFMLGYTLHMFQDPLEDMSHGWVIPFVSLYAIWTQRHALARAAGAPSWRGFAWVCFFLVFTWFGSRGQQSRLEQVALFGLIWSIPYAFWGRGVARLMAFPAAYLLFTVPVSSYLDFFTIHLRILSSGIATEILNGFGLTIERSGTALFSRTPGGEFNVDVADPCSGIRSLFAMMALAAAYAHFTLKTRLEKGVLFFCALPIAMVGNMFRIFSICLVARWWGQEVATGFYHDYSGFVIFLVGVLLMFQAAGLATRLEQGLRRRGFLINDPSADPASSALPAPVSVSGRSIGLVVAVGLLTVGTFQLNRLLGSARFDNLPFIADVLPDRVGGFIGDQPWFCHNEQCSESLEERTLLAKGRQKDGGFTCPSCGGKMFKLSLGEYQKLPKDTTMLKRIYRSVDGLTYSVNVVLSGRSRGSIHRAELCLPAQGFVMLSATTQPLRLSGGKPKKMRIIQAQRSSSDHRFALVYWFASRNRESTSHVQRIWLDIWDRSIHNRINRWAMVAINVSSGLDSQESVDQLESFIGEFYPQLFR